jgi:sugar phosphate isomerase/epimerase
MGCVPQAQRLPFVLTAYALPHVIGLLPTKTGQPHPRPMQPVQLMDAAAELGLSGLEFPLKTTDPGEIDALREAAAQRDLRLIPDYMVMLDADCEAFRDFLRASKRLGATTTRALLSTLLCGDRRSLGGGWEGRLNAIAQRLRAVLPLAEELGLCVALENHQDATTDDLLRLHEMSGGSRAYGVTLDTGNPLSVGEEPVEAARRMAPLIRHVHLKDYTIHFAPEGYRLVRCAAGDGCVDFQQILRIVRANGHDVMPGVEVAAQATRTIPLLEPGWWSCYPPRPAHEFAAALKVLWQHGRPAHEPYSSAWEQGEDSEQVEAEEWDVLRKSVAYFKSIG